MSIAAETVRSLLGAHPYLLLFPLVVADHDIQRVFTAFEKLYELAIPSRRNVIETLRSSPRAARSLRTDQRRHGHEKRLD